MLCVMASNEHQEIVKGLINHFKKIGLTITCAAYEGYDECEKKGRHEPDVVAKDSSGLHYIGEAETGDSLDDTNTEEQFKDFSNRRMKVSKKDIPFHIGIPKSCEQELLAKLKELGIEDRKNIFYVTF